MLIGETATEPSVKEGVLSAEDCMPPWPTRALSKSDWPVTQVMPRSAAVLTTLHSPTLLSSIAK